MLTVAPKKIFTILLLCSFGMIVSCDDGLPYSPGATEAQSEEEIKVENTSLSLGISTCIEGGCAMSLRWSDPLNTGPYRLERAFNAGFVAAEVLYQGYERVSVVVPDQDLPVRQYFRVMGQGRMSNVVTFLP